MLSLGAWVLSRGTEQLANHLAGQLKAATAATVQLHGGEHIELAGAARTLAKAAVWAQF